MKFAIFLAQGFEESEAVVTIDILRRADILIDLVSIDNDLIVISSHKIIIKADKTISDINYLDYHGFILPGGTTGVDNLMKCEKLKSLLITANSDNKIIAAICAAPQILGYLGIINNRKVTSYPGCTNWMEKTIYKEKKAVVIDNNIITSSGIGSSIYFALGIVEKVLGKNRACLLKNELIIIN